MREKFKWGRANLNTIPSSCILLFWVGKRGGIGKKKSSIILWKTFYPFFNSSCAENKLFGFFSFKIIQRNEKFISVSPFHYSLDQWFSSCNDYRGHLWNLLEIQMPELHSLKYPDSLSEVESSSLPICQVIQVILMQWSTDHIRISFY